MYNVDAYSDINTDPDGNPLMKRRLFSLLFVLVTLLSVGCSSGGDSPSCGFDNQTTLADLSEAPWPKFARDNTNSGRIENVTIEPAPVARWVFPSLEEESPLSPISNSALVGSNGRVYLVGTANETGDAEVKLYVLDVDTGKVLNNITPTPEPTPIETPAEPTPVETPIEYPPTIGFGTIVTGTPLLAADDTVYVPFGDGWLSRFEVDNEEALTATVIAGFLSASPTIANDGTVYLGSVGGAFPAVCPNGIPRFIVTVGGTQSSAAVVEGEDDTERMIVLAGNDAQVRAVDYLGRHLWVFFASAVVQASVVIDQRELESGDNADRVYVADKAGWVFARQLENGAAVWTRRAGSGAPISATPALGTGVLYVADEGGTLYALDIDSGEPVWSCTVDGAIRSSLAVASSDAGETVVFGADDAMVYAVDTAAASGCTTLDSCNCSDVALWTFAVDATVGRASPAIDFDGTVYIGTEAGHLYAIGAPFGTRAPTATPTPTHIPDTPMPTTTPDEAP